MARRDQDGGLGRTARPDPEPSVSVGRQSVPDARPPGGATGLTTRPPHVGAPGERPAPADLRGWVAWADTGERVMDLRPAAIDRGQGGLADLLATRARRPRAPAGEARAGPVDAAVSQRAGADPPAWGRTRRSPWPWLAALLNLLALTGAALSARTIDACGRARRARWGTTRLAGLAAAPGRGAGAIAALRGRAGTLLPGRFFRRAPEPTVNTRAAVTDFATDDVDAAAQYLVGVGATWVGAVQVGGDRCVVLRTAGGRVVRLVRAHRQPHHGSRAGAAIGDGAAGDLLQALVPEPPQRGWARGLPAAAGSGTNLPGALVLGMCGLATLLVVTGTEDMLGRPRPAAGPEPTDRAAVAVATPHTSPPPAPPTGPDRVRVAGTEGQGANVRVEPRAHAAPAKVAPEGAVLELVGPDRAADGRTWRNVRDPADGVHGWIAAEFLAAGPP